MKKLMIIYLIISTVGLIGCGAVVQPINDTVSPIQAPAQAVNNTISPIQTPLKVVKEVTATPNKAVVVTGESTVVHKTIQGASVGIVAGLKTPTPLPTPKWVDNNLVVLETSWPDVIELQVGQQIAIMSKIKTRYGWETKYNTNVLERVEDVTKSNLPEADLIWTAKKVGKTHIDMYSGPPPCHEQPQPCNLGGGISLDVDVKVVP